MGWGGPRLQGEGQQCSRCSLCPALSALLREQTVPSPPSTALHRPPWALRLHGTPRTGVASHSHCTLGGGGRRRTPPHAGAPTGQPGSRIAYPEDGAPGGKPDIHQGVLPSTAYAAISPTRPVLTFSSMCPTWVPHSSHGGLLPLQRDTLTHPVSQALQPEVTNGGTLVGMASSVHPCFV